jgi:hypothetical protein
MSYRELAMIDVKEVLRRWSAGHGDRKIGREAGVDVDELAEPRRSERAVVRRSRATGAFSRLTSSACSSRSPW